MEKQENIPQDPYILLSYVNTRLRDDYPDIGSMCDDLAIDRGVLEKRLADAGFEYMPEINQFR